MPPAPKKEELSNKLDQVLEKLEELSAEIGVLAELSKTPVAPTAPGVSQEVYNLLQNDYHELNRKYSALVVHRIQAPTPAPAPVLLQRTAQATAPTRARPQPFRHSHILRNY